jgi:hypothetical protein
MRLQAGARLLLICAGLLIAQLKCAAEPDDWKFEVTPNLLAVGMNGTLGVNGVTTNVDASFSDIWNNLDAAFLALFTAQKGRWSFGLEGVYMKLEESGLKTLTGPRGERSVNGQLDATTSLFVGVGSVGYRVLDEKTKVDLVGALRYTNLNADMDVKVQFTSAVVFPGGDSSASGSASWIDFVIGARVRYPIVDNVSLVGYADVGTGGSDLTYQFLVGVNWEFSEVFAAKVGYRYLSWDYEKEGTVWDMSASGPYLGLGIRF